MTHLHCISYARGHRVKRVGVHGCCHSPFLVNGWWTRYIGRCPIELHGLHGYKSTLCMVLMVRACSKYNVLKSQEVSKSVQCFCFKAVSESVQCICFKAVSEIVQYFCFKAVLEILQCFCLKRFRRLSNAFVLKRFRRLSNAFCFKAVLEIIQCFCFIAILEIVQCLRGSR